MHAINMNNKGFFGQITISHTQNITLYSGEGFNTRQNKDKHMVNKHTDNSIMLSLYGYIPTYI